MKLHKSKIFKPILFSTPMVEAIQDESKTQTRRIIKNQPDDRGLRITNVEFEDWHGNQYKSKYKTGDILWVRETWRLYGWESSEGFINIQYKDGKVEHFYPDVDGIDEWLLNKIDKLIDKGYLEGDPNNEERLKFTDKKPLWEPSIFMPKWATRIFLEVTNVRVERLQDISEADSKAEGVFDNNCAANGITQYKSGFQDLWESINGKESWNENHWVWVYDFKRIEKPNEF